MNTDDNRHLRALELFHRIEDVLELASTDTSVACKTMHETLVIICHDGTTNTNQAYGNLFSQVDYICHSLAIDKIDVWAIQRMRHDSNRKSGVDKKLLADDCRALALLVSKVYECDIPHFLLVKIPKQYLCKDTFHRIDYRCIRCIVAEIDDLMISVEADTDEENKLLKIDINNDHQQYLAKILHRGLQLNLVDVRRKDEGEEGFTADYIIVEPDYLVDISSLARCFTPHGHSPLEYLICRMTPAANSQAILLGNFAGALLDDAISRKEKCNWKNTLWQNFRDKALEYSACNDLNLQEPFAKAAEIQAENILRVTEKLFGPQGSYDYDKAMLEPSFVCEMLGIQGRVDLMTTDFHLLVEQKSGKNWNIQTKRPNEYGSFQKEDHYVQVLLYYGVLKYNFNLAANDTDIRLLYSKYPLPGGLVVVNFYRKLLFEAIKLRNRIVALEFMIARDGFERILPLLTPTNINEYGVDDNLWHRYTLPQLNDILQPLQLLSETERAYLCRMMTFVYREQISAKVGAQEGVGNSMADLWNMPLEEKIETGNIYCNLSISKLEKTNCEGGYDLITLSVPEYGADFLPNFRQGDMVYLYAYRANPDVRKAILFKGVMAEMNSREIVVCLNNPQQNANNFSVCPPAPDNAKRDAARLPLVYAIEHCGSDASATAAIRSLHQFAAATKASRNLMMGVAEPHADKSRTLSKQYNPTYDDIILKAKQADDYFLLIGPPGTGKTSMALHYLVEEELQKPEASILLMAYTNRAVDEICGMLVDNGYDFIRIGNEYTCDERFRSYLLSHQLDGDTNLAVMRNRIDTARIMVATTSTMQSRSYVFGIKKFSLLIVDEASQILEPNIIGLLCSATRPTEEARTAEAERKMSKFILIGDYKQLPAVVQQDGSEAMIANPQLQSIGLTDCRNSLFERLILNERRHSRTDFVGVLNKYGRLHPSIAVFPNEEFYKNEHLEPVPLPHQLDDSIQRRLLFLPSAYCASPEMSDKVNVDEAKMVAGLIKQTYEEYAADFNPNKTIGVIVPYRNQIAMIRREMEKLNIAAIMPVCVDTVERYQGSQRDVIIYATTIQHLYQLDFLTANSFEEDGRIIDRKLNVAITRARKQLYVVGNKEVLSHNSLYAKLIKEYEIKQ